MWPSRTAVRAVVMVRGRDDLRVIPPPPILLSGVVAKLAIRHEHHPLGVGWCGAVDQSITPRTVVEKWSQFAVHLDPSSSPQCRHRGM